MTVSRRFLAGLVVLGLAVAGCAAEDGGARAGSDVKLAAGADDVASIRGAGSSFVDPLFQAWIERYRTVAPTVGISFAPVGSPQGVEQLLAGDVDFAVSEVPLTPAQQLDAGGFGEILQIPVAAGGIALAYNLPGVERLNLSAQAVAGIFSGDITRWDDPALTRDNPGPRLPDTPVRVIHRSDAAATTQVFTEYLRAAAGGAWGVAPGNEIAWPTGTGAEGAGGVAAAVADTEGAIGYTSPGHALEAELPVALLGTRAGTFVGPTPEAASAGLAGAGANESDLTVRLFFTSEAPQAYPASMLSYLMYRPRTSDSELSTATADALRHFVVWALTEGQRSSEPLGYPQVPIATAARSIEVVQR